MTPALPSSSRRTAAIASSVNATPSGSNGLSASTSAAERMGRSMIGPTSGSMRRSTPMGSSGSMMSANITAASTPSSRTGMSVTSAHRSGVLASSRIS
jgi:hypothetical protein